MIKGTVRHRKFDYRLGGLRSPTKVAALGLAQSENILRLLEGPRVSRLSILFL
jgi:hypothetical protein